MHEVLEPAYEQTEIEGIPFTRDVDGVWRYSDSWLPVPGARDMTLTERFRPKLIIDAREMVERVVVSGDDIAAAPDLLGWCIDDGTPIVEEGELVEVLVPFEQWQQHNRVPGELISPEHHGSEAEQQVAAAERQVREAEQSLEKAVSYRAEVLRRHADEMTRQEARKITGLSVGRIQQLIREPLDDLDQLDQQLLSLVKVREPKSMKALHKLLSVESGIVHPTDLVKRRVLRLGERELLTASSRDGFKINPAGEEALRASSEARQPEIFEEVSE